MDFTNLNKHIETLEKSFDQIPEERKKPLQDLAMFVKEKIETLGRAHGIFICTHNSRRSHLAQVWAQAAAHRYGVEDFIAFSGGTEATALHPNTARALETTGFHIVKLSESDNPIYQIKYDGNKHPVIGFSKTFDNPFNPQTRFAAVMTCSHADANCPFIPTAARRISLPYEDPKEADGQSNEADVYIERSNEIGREMLFVFDAFRNL